MSKRRRSTVQALRREAQIGSWVLRLDGTEPRHRWMDRAKCSDEPVVTFRDEKREEAARLLCHHCPVRIDCMRQAAIEENASPSVRRYGVFYYRGGFDAPTRRAIYQRMLNQQGEPS